MHQFFKSCLFTGVVLSLIGGLFLLIRILKPPMGPSSPKLIDRVNNDYINVFKRTSPYLFEVGIFAVVLGAAGLLAAR